MLFYTKYVNSLSTEEKALCFTHAENHEKISSSKMRMSPNAVYFTREGNKNFFRIVTKLKGDFILDNQNRINKSSLLNHNISDSCQAGDG